ALNGLRKMRERELLLNRIGGYHRTEEVFLLAVAKRGKIDSVISTLHSCGERWGGRWRALKFRRDHPSPGSISGNQPIDSRICKWRVENYAIELDGISGIKAAVLLSLNYDRQLVPIDK